MKRLNDFYKQYEGLIKLILMAAPLVFGAWKYLGTYIDMPDRMDAWEARARRDSLHYVKIIKDNAIQDSIQTAFLLQDWDSIYEINKKLKRNYIY